MSSTVIFSDDISYCNSQQLLRKILKQEKFREWESNNWKITNLQVRPVQLSTTENFKLYPLNYFCPK